MPVIVLTAGQVNTGSPMESGRAPVPDSQISAQAALAQLSTVGEQRLVSEIVQLLRRIFCLPFTRSWTQTATQARDCWRPEAHGMLEELLQ